MNDPKLRKPHNTSPYRELVYLAASEYPSEAANSVQVIKQCNGMARCNLDITVLAKNNSCSQKNTDEIYRDYGFANEVNLVLMKTWRWVPRRITSLIYPFWVASKLLRKKDAIIYGRHVAGLFGAALVLRKLPMIYECHGPPNTTESTLLRALVKFGFLNRLVVISDALRKIIYRNYAFLRSVDMVVAHDGCEEISVKKVNATNGLSVGYVGSFYRGRGIDLIGELSRRLPAIKFHLIGGTEEMFNSLVESAKPDNIVIHGRVFPAELANYYSLFTVALAPYGKNLEVADGSNTVEYMSPLKIFEYMGYAKAIVASDLPVITEILKDNVNALLVTPDDIDAWCRALESMRDSAVRERLSKKAKKDARHYSWSERAKKILIDYVQP